MNEGDSPPAVSSSFSSMLAEEQDQGAVALGNGVPNFPTQVASL